MSETPASPAPEVEDPPVAPQWREELPVKEPGVPPPPPPRVNRVRWRLAVALVLAAGLLFLLYWLRPPGRSAIVPLWVTEYPSSSLPPVPQAAKDRDALVNGEYFVNADGEMPVLDRTHFAASLADLTDRPADVPVCVYLSGRCGRGERGELLFYPTDAGPERPQAAVALRSVLEALHRCPARNQLLVLDIMYPYYDPVQGILGEETAAAVQAELDGVEDSRRLVLCACSPGQTALASPEMGRTVFGYYFEEALRGWADGYGSNGARDGRVSVRELAEFTRARVARWAARNLGARQLPTLLGHGADFTLVTLHRRQPQPPVPAAEAQPYPDWLAQDWDERAKWWAEGRQHVAARLLRQRDALLLNAERDLLAGQDGNAVRDRSRAELARLEKAYAQQKVLPAPEPRTLAQAALVHEPDHAVTAALKELLTKPQTTPPTDKTAEPPAKRAADFLARFKDKTHLDFAFAACTVATEDREFTPEKLRFLNLLLRSQEPRPRFVETLFLERLEQLPADVWPREVIRRALETVRLGKRAAARADAFPRLRGLLEEAAQRRHDGEVLLLASGYAPLDEADRLLKEAGQEYETLVLVQDAFARGQQTLDDALVILPAYVGYLELRPQDEPAWLTAVQAAEELAGALAAEGNGPAGKKEGLGELRQAAQGVLRRTEYLRQHLQDIQIPFTAAGLGPVLEAAGRPNAGAGPRIELDALLRTPFLSAADRKRAWQANRDLARRLHTETLAVDEDEDRQGQPTFLPGDSAQEREQDVQKARDQAARRARWSATLLSLGGLTLPAPQPVKGNGTTAEDAALRESARALRRAWNEELPARLKKDTDPFARDRLARVFPPETPLPVLDDAATNPQVQRRVAETTALLGWLADRWRYAARDGGDAAFYDTASGEYAQAAGGLAASFYVDLSGTPEPLRFALDKRTVTYRLGVTPVGGAGTATVRLLTPGEDWLGVEAEKGENAGRLGFRIDLKTGAEQTSSPPPRGVLVAARYQGRTFHRFVPLALPWTVDQVNVFFAVAPESPEDRFTELRLRPVKGESYYLYVQNPAPRPRNLTVQLKASGVAVQGGEVKIAVGPKSTVRVTFPPQAAAAPAAPTTPPAAGAPATAAAPPAAEWPELLGPLEVRVLDVEDKNAVVAEQKFDVRLARAWDYVQVSDIRFFPSGYLPGGKNRLEVHLRALRPLSGPPCVVELALPGDRIPGFLGSPKGTFRGELPPDGKELRLYAEDLRFREGTEEEGIVYLNVDGRERAFVFRTMFRRYGNVTFPRQDRTPELRIAVGRFAPSDPRESIGVRVDNPPDGAKLEVGLGTYQGTEFQAESTRTHDSPFRRRITFTPSGPGGAFVFDALEQDWTVPFDTSKTVGQRVVRARLLDARGIEILTVTRAITVDDTPPRAVRFLDLAAQAKHGTTLTVQALGEDPESGISEVFFFLGKPADGKVPPNTAVFPAQPRDASKTWWTAPVPLPPDKKGAQEISVRFVNGAGRDSFATGTVELLDQEPIKPAEVRGTVSEGERVQPDLDVQLLDEKGNEKAKVKTGPDGTFRFEGVAPGKYVVKTSKPAARRKGQANVTVTPGGVVVLKIELSI